MEPSVGRFLLLSDDNTKIQQVCEVVFQFHVSTTKYLTQAIYGAKRGLLWLTDLMIGSNIE